LLQRLQAQEGADADTAGTRERVCMALFDVVRFWHPCVLLKSRDKWSRSRLCCCACVHERVTAGEEDQA